jgi:hypothetical protein
LTNALISEKIGIDGVYRHTEVFIDKEITHMMYMVEGVNPAQSDHGGRLKLQSKQQRKHLKLSPVIRSPVLGVMMRLRPSHWLADLLQNRAKGDNRND